MKRKRKLSHAPKYVTGTGDTPPVTNTLPMISVVIPIYNASGTIRRCLTSVLHQNYNNLEIICINDGSTDDTLDVLYHIKSEYVASGGEHQLLIIDKLNGGYGTGVNTGIDASNGEYISIVESDDWIEQSFYSDAVAYRNRLNIDADIIKTPYNRIIRRTVDADTASAIKINCSYKTLVPENKSLRCVDTPQFMLHHPSIWSAIYRKDFLVGNGIRMREEPGAAWVDNPFMYETLLRANSIIYLDRAYYNYVEDLPEEERAFYRGNPSVPSSRFLENHEIICGLAEMTTYPDNTWLSHYARGFNYIDFIQQGGDEGDDEAEGYINDIISVIPPVAVLLNEELSSSQKSFYFDRRSELFGEANTAPMDSSLEENNNNADTSPISSKRDTSTVYLIAGDNQRYIRYLIGQGIYRLGNTNFRFTLESTKTFLKKLLQKSRE